MVIDYKDLYFKYMSMLYSFNNFDIEKRLNKLSEWNILDIEKNI